MDDRDVDAKIAELLTESRRWVASLPREILGSFAVDAETLVAVQAHIRYREVGKDSLLHRDLDAFIIRVRKEIQNAWIEPAQACGHYHSVQNVTAEVFFWWLRSDEKECIRYARKSLSNARSNAVPAGLALLEKVASVPFGLPYFERGIWDVELIRHCITEGIDVSLAESVGVSRV